MGFISLLVCRLPGVSLILGGVDVVPAPSFHFLSYIVVITAKLFGLVSCLMFSSIFVRLSDDVFQIQLLYDEVTWILHFLYA